MNDNTMIFILFDSAPASYNVTVQRPERFLFIITGFYVPPESIKEHRNIFHPCTAGPVQGFHLLLKQNGNIFKFCPGFWHYRIIYAKKYRLCTKEIRNQPESHGCSDVHEPGVIRFRMGTGIIKGIERFPGNTG